MSLAKRSTALRASDWETDDSWQYVTANVLRTPGALTSVFHKTSVSPSNLCAAPSWISLDAQIAPSLPVIVLGFNERTDDAGNLPQTEQGSTGVVAEATTAYEVRIVRVDLIHDKEPWVKGDAEIAMRAQSHGCSGTSHTEYNWPNLNNDDDVWGGTRYLGLTRCDVIFSWWEDDGGDWDFTLGFEGVSLGIGMDDGDDLIGGIELRYSSFQGGSDSGTGQWDALQQWTD